MAITGVTASLLFAPVLSALLTGLWLHLARRSQWLDHPNARSAHQVSTPHGGGIGLLLAFTAVVGLEVPWSAAYLGLLGLALLLMLLGALDDRWHLPVSLRLSAYAACCLLLVAWIPDPRFPWLGWLLVPALLWLVNLYNFMDGIDALAGLQAGLASGSAALLAMWGGYTEYALFCALLAACVPGFLIWNWPPARLFLGDAGSIPLGFLLGGLAWLGWVEGSVPPGSWAVLLAAFVTDASWTLCARWRRGARLTEAHREHAYQRLANHWGSHRAVAGFFLCLFLLWLFPLSMTIWYWPKFQVSLVLLAYFPLLLGMAFVRRLP